MGPFSEWGPWRSGKRGVTAKVWLAVGSLGPRSCLAVLVPECLVLMGSDRWSDPRIRPLAYWVGAIVAENAKCGLLTLPSPGSLALPKIVNKKISSHTRGYGRK